jgi:hypothetical protein
LVAAAHSPEAFRQVTDAMAAALPTSCKHRIEGGHLINPADPRCWASWRNWSTANAKVRAFPCEAQIA